MGYSSIPFCATNPRALDKQEHTSLDGVAGSWEMVQKEKRKLLPPSKEWKCSFTARWRRRRSMKNEGSIFTTLVTVISDFEEISLRKSTSYNLRETEIAKFYPWRWIFSAGFLERSSTKCTQNIEQLVRNSFHGNLMWFSRRISERPRRYDKVAYPTVVYIHIEIFSPVPSF